MNWVGSGFSNERGSDVRLNRSTAHRAHHLGDSVSGEAFLGQVVDRPGDSNCLASGAGDDDDVVMVDQY